MNPSREEAARPILSLGRYALFGELATGGMATVHFGRMSSLGGFNRTVAIKRMRRDIARDPEFVAMFLDEARLTSRIEHPNVVATLDVVAESGEVFLVMEYVRGESLQRLRRAAKGRRERVPVPVAISIMVGTLAGLHAAHEAVGEDGVPLGIVHRDVSPQNIMVGEDGIARITDFGIAKAESRLQVTHEGQMKGKLPYMAPEQLGSSRKRIDRRVDIFSAAVVLWELLAGKGLFRADHPGETIAKVLSAPIPALAPFRPDVTPALDRVLRRALSRKPEQRPQTAEDFALELEEAIETGPASPRIVGGWVSSLAGDVLANRLKYIREMESTSWNLDVGVHDPRGSLSGAETEAASRGRDREPDLSSDPAMHLADRAAPVPAWQPPSPPSPGPPPPPRPPPPLAVSPQQTPLPVPHPPPVFEKTNRAPAPPPVVPPMAPPVSDWQEQAQPTQPFETIEPVEESSMPSMSSRGSMPSASSRGSMPSVSSMGAMPSVSSMGSMPSASSMGSMPSVSSMGSNPSMSQMGVPPSADETSLPSISSDAAMATGLPGRSPVSIPPFQKNRLPFIIVGVVVASVALLLIVGVVSSRSWFDDDPPEPGVVATASPVPTPMPSPTATETAVPPASVALDAAPAEPSAVADVETPPSEKDTKGGSSGTSTARPVYTPPPKATPKGPRPYLPDLP